jgi:hypothetical protein
MGGKTRETSELHPDRGEPEMQTDHESAGAEYAAPADMAESTQPDASDTPAGEPSRPRSADRAGLLVGGAVLAVCSGLVLYGVLHTRQGDAKPEHRTPTAAVTYEVTGQGTADITYQARSGTGDAVVVKAATLPWHKTVDVPLGKEPIVSIVLGEKGGQAHCALAIRGRHVQSATASGVFGRATCSGALPAEDGDGETR